MLYFFNIKVLICILFFFILRGILPRYKIDVLVIKFWSFFLLNFIIYFYLLLIILK